MLLLSLMTQSVGANMIMDPLDQTYVQLVHSTSLHIA